MLLVFCQTPICAKSVPPDIGFR